MYTTCIVIPCYNEEDYFLHSKYISFLKKQKNILICFVNDGSYDNTNKCITDLAEKFPKNVVVINHKKNKGKAEAVKTGVNFCNNNYDFTNIAYLDADLAVSLEECIELSKFLKEDVDFVFGSRVLRIGSIIERKKSRHYIGRIIATLISYILSLKVYDTQCGCKLFKKELSQKVFIKSFVSRWLFDVEIFFRILGIYGKEKAVKKMLEIPLNKWIDRGDSKVKLTYFFKLWFDLLKIKKEYSKPKTLSYKKIISNFNPNWLSLSIIILCIILFNICYGLEIIIPTNINWLLSAYHDWGQHYLGWTYFRDAPWGFPLGDMYNYYYPLGTNVGFTDSIPILALIFKPFSSLLPSDFQYFGTFMFASFVLNAVYITKILRLYKVNILIILGTIIIINTGPLFLYRGMHPALTAHWLIIASFYYYLCPNDKLNSIKANKYQIILFILSVGIHPYLAAMIFGFSIILPIKHYFYDKSLNLKRVILFPIISLTTGLFFWYLMGMIGNNQGTTISDAGFYGISTFNLNSFFNPLEYASRFISGKKIMSLDQLEAFSYLGLGLIIITFFTVFFFLNLVFRKKLYKYKFILPLFIFTLILLLFSISNIVTLGDTVLFKYPIPNFIKILGSIFRANGRFCWPFYYFIVIISIISFSKIKINKYVKTIIYIMLVGIQLYDIQATITSRHLNYSKGDFKTKLSNDKQWIHIFSEFDEIITYPPYKNTMVYNSDYQDLMYLAQKAKTPITTGYVARMKPNYLYIDSIQKNITKGDFYLEKKSLFVTTQQYIDLFNSAIFQKKVTLRKLDDFFLIYSNKIELKKYFKNSISSIKFQDSIFKNVNKKSNDFVKIKNSSLSNLNNIKFGLDEVTISDYTLKIRGWAFDEFVKTNQNDSIFVALTNKTDSYLFKTNLISRPDVTSYFKRENIDLSGFDILLFGNKLPPENYDINLVIKNDTLKAFGKTNNSLEIK